MNGAARTGQRNYRDSRKGGGAVGLQSAQIRTESGKTGYLSFETANSLTGQIRGHTAERRMVQTEAPAMLQHGRAHRG